MLIFVFTNTGSPKQDGTSDARFGIEGRTPTRTKSQRRKGGSAEATCKILIAFLEMPIAAS
jgi:hypothetical protein